MNKTVNNFYMVGTKGDFVAWHDYDALLGSFEETNRLLDAVEQERDNALLERDEAVAKASDLAQELSGSQALVKFLDRGRADDWEKLKSWNNLTREKHEEVVQLKRALADSDREQNAWKTRALERQERVEGLVQELAEAVQYSDDLLKSFEPLKTERDEYKEAFERALKDREVVEAEMDERVLALSRQRDKAIQEMKLRGDAIERQEKQIEQLRIECANKRSQIKGLQVELDELGSTDYMQLRDELNAQIKETKKLQSELDATRESGQYFADRTLTLTQQVEDLQANLIEEKNIGAALERQLEISRQSALYWHDRYHFITP